MRFSRRCILSTHPTTSSKTSRRLFINWRRLIAIGGSCPDEHLSMDRVQRIDRQ